MKYTFIFLLPFSLIIGSCSNEEGSDQDPIIGNWAGEVVQPNFGTSTISVSISSLTEETTSARLSSEVTDLSICDDTIFFCEFGSCTTTWTYKGRNGSNYLFSEIVDPGSPCGDGDIVARLTGDNTLTYTWTDIVDPTNTATSTVTRQ